VEDFILNLNKPRGISSTRVGNILKKQWQEKKIGHLGTLDPLATGVLPLFTGKYTKLIPYFQKEPKTYVATIWLGAHSDTLDIQSKTTYASVCAFSLSKIQETLKEFQGELQQTAPLYSALKYKGKPQYYYMRKNMTIPPKSRVVTIFGLDLLAYNHPKLKIKVRCSSGCYIRSLARDIGQKLGVFAILEQLERTEIGKQFTKKNIVCLDEAKKKSYYKDVTLDPWNLLSSYSLVNIDEIAIIPVKQGQRVKYFSKSDLQEEVFAFSKKKLLAVGVTLKCREGQFFQPKKLFV
jgi:tRNA pseudouridine55 synthase